jgi:hypothetical protein
VRFIKKYKQIYGKKRRYVKKKLNSHVQHCNTALFKKSLMNMDISLYTKVPDIGHAIAEAVSRWLPTAAVRVRDRVWQVGFVVDKVAPGQVFSEYICFPCQPHFIPSTSPSS